SPTTAAPIPTMSNASFRVPPAVNEPVKDYRPGSGEREALLAALSRQRAEQIEIPLILGGEAIHTGDLRDAVCPHEHGHVLARCHQGDASHVAAAAAACKDAAADWAAMPWEERAAIFLKAAELLAGPWRPVLNAATMLGQSKNAFQA